MVIEKSTEIILENGNGKKLIANENGEEIIKNLTYDLFSLVFHGANSLSGIFSGSFNSLISLNNLIRFAPEVLSPYILKLIPIQMYLESKAGYSKALAKNITESEMKVWEFKGHITDHIEQINLRNGEEFIKQKYNSLQSTKNKFTVESELNEKITSVINNLIGYIDNIVDIMYFGYKFLSNQITVNQIPLLKSSINEVTSFLSSNLAFQIDNIALINSKERITLMFEIISQTGNNAAHTPNNLGKIIFTNYTLVLDDTVLVHIDNFAFECGKHYAISGKSGCGKTSTLIDLKEGASGALSSFGEISVPYKDNIKPKIMFIDQKLYLPKDSTLLEIIYFPKILSLLNEQQVLELKEKVLSLFQELDIDQFINTPDNEKGLMARLDSKEDFKLSGGQEKKIAIMQAIINEPDILIMDETFTGLDKHSSLIKVQQAINKYLPNVTLLVVDHDVEGNNCNGFYHFEVHFAEGVIAELPTVSKICAYREKSEGWSIDT